MVVCNIQDGLFCESDIQPNNECDDYEVRLAKMMKTEECGYTTSPTKTTIAPTTTPYASCMYDFLSNMTQNSENINLGKEIYSRFLLVYG